MFGYYETQAKQNLNEAEEIAKENGTIDSLSWEISDLRSTIESMSGAEDDIFSDVYQESIMIKARA